MLTKKMETIRKRRVQGRSAINSQPLETREAAGKEDDNYDVTELRGSFWLTRIVFIRSLGFVYCKRP